MSDNKPVEAPVASATTQPEAAAKPAAAKPAAANPAAAKPAAAKPAAATPAAAKPSKLDETKAKNKKALADALVKAQAVKLAKPPSSVPAAKALAMKGDLDAAGQVAGRAASAVGAGVAAATRCSTLSTLAATAKSRRPSSARRSPIG